MKQTPFALAAVAALLSAPVLAAFDDADDDESEDPRIPRIDVRVAAANYAAATNALAREDDRAALRRLVPAKSAVLGCLDELATLRASEDAMIAIRELADRARGLASTNLPAAKPLLDTLEERLLVLRLSLCERVIGGAVKDFDDELVWSLQSVRMALDELARGEASAVATDCDLVADTMRQRLREKSRIEEDEPEFLSLRTAIEATERDLLARRETGPLSRAEADAVRRDYAETRRLLRADDFAGAREPLARVEATLRAHNADGVFDGFLEAIAESQETIHDLLEQAAVRGGGAAPDGGHGRTPAP